VNIEGVTIRAFRAGDEAGIIECSNRTSGHSLTLDEWSWRHPPSPEGRPIVVAVSNNAVVGYVAAVERRLHIEGRTYEAAEIGGAVDSSAHDPGHGNELLTRLAEALIAEFVDSRRFDLVFFLGSLDDATDWAAAIDGVAAEPSRSELLIRRGDPPSGLRRLAYRAEPARDWEPQLGELWRRAGGAYPVSVVRDPALALARYAGHPSIRYHRFLVFPRFSSRPVAFAAFHCAEGTCRWVDLVRDHDHPGALGLLAHVSNRLARQTGSQTEEVWFTGDDSARDLLGGAGFVGQRYERRVGMAIRSSDVDTAVLEKLDRIYLTEGDLGIYREPVTDALPDHRR
jgi:hypothetical protein